MSCECPICMELITGDKNKVITECGHCFHTNCLMTSVAHNGFGCPYCRTAMAEEQNDEESEYDDDEEEEIDEPYDDYVLRGFRFFMGEEDEEDIAQEQYEQQIEEAHEEHNAVVENDHRMDYPSAAFVTEKLVERGVRMEDLVKLVLNQHDAYQVPVRQQEALERLDGEIYGKVRIILGAYRGEEYA